MTHDLQPFTGRKGRPVPAATPEGLPSIPEAAERRGGSGEGRLSHDHQGQNVLH